MAKSPKKSAEPSTPHYLALRPSIVLTDDTPVYYINHAEFAGSIYDIGMIVARMPTKPTPERLAIATETGVLEVEAELQLIFPPSLVPGLIRALTKQKETYEKQFGLINDPDAGET